MYMYFVYIQIQLLDLPTEIRLYLTNHQIDDRMFREEEEEKNIYIKRWSERKI